MLLRSAIKKSHENVKLRDRPRFFDQVGHETMYASSGNKHFITKSCHRQTYKIMNNLLEHLKFHTFKVIFLCEKLVEYFHKNNSMKNI